VLRFREAMANGDLELAARLYSGDLLPACYDDWVMDERAKLRAEAYGVLVRLRDEAAGRDDHEATIRHAQCIIDLEPTDEVAVRIQMEAHLALGDRAAALRSYHRYAEVLERDLALQRTTPSQRSTTAPASHSTVRNCRTRTAPFRSATLGRDLERTS
jgi:DNA-binding SARP family transcriptional activator